MTNPNNTGSLTTTYTQNASKTQSASASTTQSASASSSSTIVTSQVITQTDQIASYFIKDLEKFVRYAHVDLIDALQVPPDYSQDVADIIVLLYEDISHMLRDRLIVGIHLLLCENELDPNTGSYPLRYHVSYAINNPLAPAAGTPTPATGTPPAAPKGTELQIPPEIWRNTRFSLLVDWDENAIDKHFHVRRPNYCFDWIPEEMRFDAVNLVQWQDAGIVLGGAEVNRAETVSPAHQKRLP